MIKEILKGKIPEELIPSVRRSFDVVGDIAVIEIPEELEGYEREIAEAIMKVHKNVKVVCKRAGKTGGIERIRPVKVILGERRTTTVHVENGFKFLVDLSKVYFSPRLQNERLRVINQVKSGELVVDMFAGVGPFAIPIAKKTKVIAIDINRYAIKLLKENIKLNKIPEENIMVFEGDCRKVIDKHEEWFGKADRIIMNYPAESEKFLPWAEKLAKDGTKVHFYHFAKDEDELKTYLPGSCEIVEIRKCGQIAPRIYRYVVDFIYHL